MKVLIPVTSFTKSGGFRVLAKLADGLIEEGNEVYFLCASVEAPYHNTKAKIIYCNRLLGSKNNVIVLLVNLFISLVRLRSMRFDIVIANHSFTALPIYLSRIKGKYVYYIQAYEPEYYEYKTQWVKKIILKFLSEISYRLPFEQIVNADIYIGYKLIRARHVVTPGLDLNIFYPNKGDLGSKEKIKIGSILRKEEVKGSKYIVEAYKVLTKMQLPIEWHFAFVDEIFLVDVKDAILLNPHGDLNLSEYYRNLDIYICSGVSQFGAIHYPIIESMACNTLVITTPYYPSRKDNSIQIEPHSIESIVEAVLYAMTNPMEKFREVALEDVAQFDWKVVVSKFNRILEEL